MAETAKNPGESRGQWTRAADLADLPAGGCLAVTVAGRTLALFHHAGAIQAVDNRCPHLGFPLHRGSVRDGILTCHWHHARFDLATGGTFDPWADDVPAFPTEIRDDAIWVDLTPRADPHDHQRRRLREGLERGISLVVAKSVIGLAEGSGDPVEPFRIGLDYGIHYRQAGWGAGLTSLTCLTNLLRHLDPADRPLALYHGLTAVARDCAGSAPRFPLRPLPSAAADLPTLKRWFRSFVELRDGEGAERCLATAVQMGADPAGIADLLFSAATDHRYLDTGHVLDFTNKALEALDLAGWENAESALTSLAGSYAAAERMEEATAWRQPIDLIARLENALADLPAALAAGRDQLGAWAGAADLLPVLLGDDPAAILAGLLAALRTGCPPVDLAGLVVQAAAERIARFPISNEFGDWDTAHHSFTFANAVHQGLRRVASPDLVRGVFDAALTVYLNRFLNVPPARRPRPTEPLPDPATILADLPGLLDRRQSIDAAAEAVAGYLAGGGDPDRLRAVLGRLLLREDRDFHTIQNLEAAFRQSELLRDTPAAEAVLIATTRYLAAHAPTARAQGQTFQTARRLHRGEPIFEEA